MLMLMKFRWFTQRPCISVWVTKHASPFRWHGGWSMFHPFASPCLSFRRRWPWPSLCRFLPFGRFSSFAWFLFLGFGFRRRGWRWWSSSLSRLWFVRSLWLLRGLWWGRWWSWSWPFRPLPSPSVLFRLGWTATLSLSSVSRTRRWGRFRPTWRRARSTPSSRRWRGWGWHSFLSSLPAAWRGGVRASAPFSGGRRRGVIRPSPSTGWWDRTFFLRTSSRRRRRARIFSSLSSCSGWTRVLHPLSSGRGGRFSSFSYRGGWGLFAFPSPVPWRLTSLSLLPAILWRIYFFLSFRRPLLFRRGRRRWMFAVATAGCFLGFGQKRWLFLFLFLFLLLFLFFNRRRGRWGWWWWRWRWRLFDWWLLLFFFLVSWPVMCWRWNRRIGRRLFFFRTRWFLLFFSFFLFFFFLFLNFFFLLVFPFLFFLLSRCFGSRRSWTRAWGTWAETHRAWPWTWRGWIGTWTPSRRWGTTWPTTWRTRARSANTIYQFQLIALRTVRGLRTSTGINSITTKENHGFT